MNPEEFINNAIKILQEECNLTSKQAEAIAYITTSLEEKNNTCKEREFFVIPA